MPESSKPTSIQLMLRLLGLECRTARSSIYSEKAEIKSPENFCCLERRHPCLLGAPAEENAAGGTKPARMPALPGLRLTSLLSAL